MYLYDSLLSIKLVVPTKQTKQTKQNLIITTNMKQKSSHICRIGVLILQLFEQRRLFALELF